VIDTDQGPALGSAIHAAVASGDYPSVNAAAQAMGRVIKDAYMPIEEHSRQYDALYREYLELHDHFGRSGSAVMKRLKQLKREVSA
jgi:L-ribulokinase